MVDSLAKTRSRFQSVRLNPDPWTRKKLTRSVTLVFKCTEYKGNTFFIWHQEFPGPGSAKKVRGLIILFLRNGGAPTIAKVVAGIQFDVLSLKVGIREGEPDQPHTTVLG